MNAATPYTAEMRDASRKVEAYKDKRAEAKRRWPDWEWEDLFEYDAKGTPVRRFIYGRWTGSFKDAKGVECGLRTDVPLTASKADVNDAKDNIAFSALYNDEMRKAAP